MSAVRPTGGGHVSTGPDRGGHASANAAAVLPLGERSAGERLPGASASAVRVYAVCRAADAAALVPVTRGSVTEAAATEAVVTEAASREVSASPRCLAAGRLVALVEDVPAAACTELELRRRLSDRVELERYARTHHAVVAAAAARAATVPLPLATIYLDEDRAVATLAGDERRLLGALDRIEGRTEWGVKVYAATPATDHEATERPAGEPSAPASVGSGAGRAHLERLRGRQRAREQRQDEVLRCADEIDRTLRRSAVAARRLRTHGAEATGRRAQVLNAAYLVPRASNAAIGEAVALLRRTFGGTVVIELTGPWPAYSFVDGGEPDADR